MIIGFTGSREGLTQHAQDTITLMLATANPEHVVHGCCIGADEDFHNIAVHIGIEVVGHPSDLPHQTMMLPAKEFIMMAPELPPLERNRDIVNGCDLLIAAPKTLVEERRSGTWATMRYAKKINRRCVVISPESGKTIPIGFVL